MVQPATVESADAALARLTAHDRSMLTGLVVQGRRAPYDVVATDSLVAEVVRCLIDRHLLFTHFNWDTWEEGARWWSGGNVGCPAQQCLQYLPMLVCAERFTDGLLISAFETGLMQRCYIACISTPIRIRDVDQMLTDALGRRYHEHMSHPDVTQRELPEYMTWEDLEKLPDHIAARIELWNGRVVWVRRGPGEHQEFTNLLWSALRRCARQAMSAEPEQCWSVRTETNVFFGPTGKSDFVTPDFMIHRCLDKPYQHVRSDRVLLVGEVLSPSNSDADMELKKARYAKAGIPWYWEVTLATNRSAIAHVHAYVLAPGVGTLPPGVSVLHQANYVLAGVWSPTRSGAIDIAHPFPIEIPWTELEFS